ncbi:MAG TPA: hypothetical protein VEC17_00530 [Candidatus Binatia bacterium]|nr:hypothetical protein [Candidatus Binatia bacterium]
MLKNQSKKTTTSNKFVEWASKNRIKSSVFAFFFVIALGAGAFKAADMLKGSPPPAATVTEEGKDIREIPNWWYVDNFGYTKCDKDDCEHEADPDNDQLSNVQEFYFNTKPKVADTNENGKTDGEDVAMGIDPSRPGNMTFEEVATDDNIVGESLVFNEDVKSILNEMVDPNKAVLPGISNDELKISQDNSPEALKEYFTAAQAVLTKYIPSDPETFVSQAIATRNEDSKRTLTKSAEKVVDELKKLPVPTEALVFHKYTVMSMLLLPIVIDPPTDESALQDQNNIEATEWYEATRAYAALIQKLQLEVTRLQN